MISVVQTLLWYQEVRPMRLSLPLVIVNLLLITSCATQRYNLRETPPPPAYDTLRARYPDYRIDDEISELIILGKGKYQSQIQSELFYFFMENTEVPVLRTLDLEKFLPGRDLNLLKGPGEEELAALSRLVDASHILLFHGWVTPHEQYRHGGSADAEILVKIVDLDSGKVLFSAQSRFGKHLEDPRPYGFSGYDEVTEPEWRELLTACFYPVHFKLQYAFGGVAPGFYPLSEDLRVLAGPVEGSPAHLAGVRKGDRIVEVGGLEWNSRDELMKYFVSRPPDQGSELAVKVDRDGRFEDFHLTFPVIPVRQAVSTGQ